MAGALITSGFQIQLGPDDAGLLLGAGTPYDITEFDGWDDSPPYSLTDVDKPTQAGAWAGAMYAQPRVMNLTLQIAGTPGFTGTPSTAQYAANVAALRALTNPGPDSTAEIPIIVSLGGQVLQASVRCQQRAMPITLGYAAPGTDTVTLQLAATDPRRYDPAVQSASTGLYAATGGLTYPITYPLNWGSVSSPGAITITNTGDTDTPPLLTITGGGTTPTITRQDTGESLMLDIALAPSDTLVIDVLNDEILFNGSSAYGLLDPSSDPISSFFIWPGSATLGLSVSAGTTTTLTAVWQSAYL